MKREKYAAVDIDSTSIDRWVKRLSEDPELEYITSGNKYVFKDKEFNQIYICKIEEVVDLDEDEDLMKEECENCKQYMVCAEHGIVNPFVFEDVPLLPNDYYETIDKMKQSIDQEMMSGYDLCNEKNIAAFQKQTETKDPYNYKFNCKRCGSVEHSHCATSVIQKEFVLDEYSLIDKIIDLSNEIVSKRSAGCDCGGQKANTTHSDWCSKGGSK